MNSPPSPRVQGAIRSVVVAAVVLAYAACYDRLARRGLREAPAHGIEGFVYVAGADLERAEARAINRVLIVVFAPANRIDRALFGTPRPSAFDCWLTLSG